MDITQKLKLYTKSAQPTREIREFDASSIGFHSVSGDSGHIVRKESFYSFEDIQIDDVSFKRSMKSYLSMNGFDDSIELHEILFIDLETTSLSIAAGSIPFLTGFAYFDSDTLIVEQIFIEDISKEKNYLEYLLPFFANAKAVATFNGASYDVPLIKNRYMLNRVYGFPMKIPVIDILIPVRRIFKKLYESLSLGSLEKNILGFEREDDIPGWLIPDVYFSFQRSGETDRIAAVAEHNAVDIVSMIRVFSIVSSIYESAFNREFSLIDTDQIKNLASSLFAKDIDLFLDMADFLGDSILDDENLFQKFSIALKRENDYEKAAEYWKSNMTLFSLNELAKYEEHKTAEYNKALEYSETAMTLIEKNVYSENGGEIKNAARWKENFEKRINRLKTKIKNQTS
ncbi:MAG TPA: ribonuclease H-like domain-containing protein [Spirochaetota bacterium]|nr:ribonuclease H-like domain-containing protein [Spirochaetota bacterium]HQO24040.1 ribonuclease H-like domain-containing protein [Spirochaetota bacterium]HQQ24633.1 ribonuclease H-like domain-containing protein [Spirochaetota bacterium]